MHPPAESAPARPARGRGRSLASPALAALCLGLLTGNIRQDEFECEEAVARLLSCCPDFPPQQLQCTYSLTTSGCKATERRPDLEPERARCLRGRSCEDLKRGGACDPERWEPAPSCRPDGGAPEPEAGPPCLKRVPACP